MPSSPAELLQLSKDLLAAGGSETWQRCVISRAYYASLHATNATFPRTAHSVRIDGESSHAEIIGRAVSYGKSLSPGRLYANQIAQAMPRLRKFRNFADYQLDDMLSAKEFSDVVLRAERVLQQCQEVERLRKSAVLVQGPTMANAPAAAAPADRGSGQAQPVEPPEPPGTGGGGPSKPSLIRIK